VVGKIYAFRWKVQNAVGLGLPSDEVYIALSDLLPAPAAIRKIRTLSSKTSINLEWDAVTAGASPGGTILGY
jgi:hypothetical protein